MRKYVPRERDPLTDEMVLACRPHAIWFRKRLSGAIVLTEYRNPSKKYGEFSCMTAALAFVNALPAPTQEVANEPV
ncbi:MAG TPA: hypothetical protein VMV19_18210 [Xanthobacteraceae bacterium]|nr:hypothetical protein [Xanthobacteraceae bacterium]